MLDPNSRHDRQREPTRGDGPFYTAVGLQLSGTVHAGDVWTLELRDTPYVYVATAADAASSDPLAASPRASRA